MNDVLEVVRTLFAALDAENWRAAAELFNHAQVEEWYASVLNIPSTEEGSEPTAHDLVRNNPDMPIDVAEYQVAEMKKYRGNRSEELVGVASWDEVARLGANEAYARYLKKRDPRQQLRSVTDSFPPEMRLSLGERAPTVRNVVLGVVAETADLAHVLYRRHWAGDEVGSLHVATCTRGRERWCIALTPEWEMALHGYSFAVEPNI